MTKILIDRAVVEQALHVATGAGYPVALIAALKAALAEPVQEPVAWVECDGELVWNNREAAIGRNLYTAPPQRPAEPVQEPYAWMAVGGTVWRHKSSQDDVPLYTHPPQRKPLTEEEIVRIFETPELAGARFQTSTLKAIAVARAIEAAHGIKEGT